MKFPALLLLLSVIFSACTTVANRRDLYSPSPAVSYARVSGSSTTTTMSAQSEVEEIPRPPAYRY